MPDGPNTGIPGVGGANVGIGSGTPQGGPSGWGSTGWGGGSPQGGPQLGSPGSKGIDTSKGRIIGMNPDGTPIYATKDATTPPPMSGVQKSPLEIAQEQAANISPTAGKPPAERNLWHGAELKYNGELVPTNTASLSDITGFIESGPQKGAPIHSGKWEYRNVGVANAPEGPLPGARSGFYDVVRAKEEGTGREVFKQYVSPSGERSEKFYNPEFDVAAGLFREKPAGGMTLLQGAMMNRQAAAPAAGPSMLQQALINKPYERGESTGGLTLLQGAMLNKQEASPLQVGEILNPKTLFTLSKSEMNQTQLEEPSHPIDALFPWGKPENPQEAWERYAQQGSLENFGKMAYAAEAGFVYGAGKLLVDVGTPLAEIKALTSLGQSQAAIPKATKLAASAMNPETLVQGGLLASWIVPPLGLAATSGYLLYKGAAAAAAKGEGFERAGYHAMGDVLTTSVGIGVGVGAYHGLTKLGAAAKGIMAERGAPNIEGFRIGNAEATQGGYVDWTTNTWVPKVTAKGGFRETSALSEAPSPKSESFNRADYLLQKRGVEEMTAHPTWGFGKDTTFTVQKGDMGSAVEWGAQPKISSQLEQVAAPAKPAEGFSRAAHLLEKAGMENIKAHPSWEGFSKSTEFSVPKGERGGTVEWGAEPKLSSKLETISTTATQAKGFNRAEYLLEKAGTESMEAHPSWKVFGKDTTFTVQKGDMGSAVEWGAEPKLSSTLEQVGIPTKPKAEFNRADYLASKRGAIEMTAHPSWKIMGKGDTFQVQTGDMGGTIDWGAAPALSSQLEKISSPSAKSFNRADYLLQKRGVEEMTAHPTWGFGKDTTFTVQKGDMGSAVEWGAQPKISSQLEQVAAPAKPAEGGVAAHPSWKLISESPKTQNLESFLKKFSPNKKANIAKPPPSEEGGGITTETQGGLLLKQKQIPKLITKAEVRPPIERTAASAAPQSNPQSLTALLQAPKPTAGAKVVPFSYERQNERQTPISKYALMGTKPVSKYAFKETAPPKTGTSSGLLLKQIQIIKPVQKQKQIYFQEHKPTQTTRTIESQLIKSLTATKPQTATAPMPTPRADTRLVPMFQTAQAQALEEGGGGGRKYPWNFPKSGGNEPPEKKKRRFNFPPIKAQERSQLASRIAVDISFARYGQATHPNLERNPSLWKQEGRIPTVELMKGSRPKGFNLKQIVKRLGGRFK